MMKRLITAVALLAFASVAIAVPTITNTVKLGEVNTKYLNIGTVADFDSLTGAVQVDTTGSFDCWPMGKNQPFPDAVTLWFDVFTKKAGLAAVTKADTIVFSLYVTGVFGATEAAERSLTWTPIWLNGDKDTVLLGPVVGTSLATGSYPTSGYYTLSAAQLATMAASSKARITLLKPGAGAAADTFRLRIRMVQSYTGWKDN